MQAARTGRGPTGDAIPILTRMPDLTRMPNPTRMPGAPRPTSTSTRPGPTSALPPPIACEHCDARWRLPLLTAGQQARCRRCGAVLGIGHRIDLSGQLALVLAALIVFVVANIFPIVVLDLQGLRHGSTLPEAIAALARNDALPVAAIAALTAFAGPLAELLVRAAVLSSLLRGTAGNGTASVLNWLARVQRWSMTEVYLIGMLVTLVKIGAMARIVPGIGLAGFAVLAVLIATIRAQGIDALWAALPHGLGPPPEPAHHRKPFSLQRTWALLLAAVLLYLPANLLPVFRTVRLGATESHTIIGGVADLLHEGSWELALIVFVASVVVPVLKIGSLALLAWTAQRPRTWRITQRARLYRIVEAIGHWSMLDIFVVALLVALVHFGALATIEPAGGAIAFGAVVVLTMFASSSFDPRLLWDHVGPPMPAKPPTENP